MGFSIERYQEESKKLDPTAVAWYEVAANQLSKGDLVFVPDANGSKFDLVSKALAGYRQMAITARLGPAGTLAPTQQPQLYGNLT